MSRLRLSVQRFLTWTSVYFHENWGAPFVLGFMVFLVVGAGCLLAGSGSWAEQLGVVAYFCLVAGVVLQLVCSWRYDHKNSCSESEGEAGD